MGWGRMVVAALGAAAAHGALVDRWWATLRRAAVVGHAAAAQAGQAQGVAGGEGQRPCRSCKVM